MKRVLVVDDDDSLRQLVAEALREARYRVELAANGAEALRLMRRRLPHAIVLDLMMPQLDGSGFVELMRLNPRFAAVPVLLVSAADDAGEAATRLGAPRTRRPPGSPTCGWQAPRDEQRARPARRRSRTAARRRGSPGPALPDPASPAPDRPRAH